MDSRSPAPGRPRKSSEPNYQVRALQRGLAILTSFTPAQPSLSLADLSEGLQVPKATIHRLLECLRGERFLDYDPETRLYSLGLRSFEVGSAYLATSPLEQSAVPFLRRLMVQTNQTACLGVIDDYQVLHLSVVEPDRPLRYHSRVGSRDFVHCTSLGKVMAAQLDDEALMDLVRVVGLPPRTRATLTDLAELRAELALVRSRGFAEDNEESAVGLRCLAAPVHSSNGRVVAAISISGPAGEFEGVNREALLPSVLAAADDLSARLGWSSDLVSPRRSATQ